MLVLAAGNEPAGALPLVDKVGKDRFRAGAGNRSFTTPSPDARGRSGHRAEHVGHNADAPTGLLLIRYCYFGSDHLGIETVAFVTGDSTPANLPIVSFFPTTPQTWQAASAVSGNVCPVLLDASAAGSCRMRSA